MELSKKFFCIVLSLFLFSQTVLAADVSRVQIKNANINDIDKITLAMLDSYNNLLINVKKDTQNHIYSAEYTGVTLLSFLGFKKYDNNKYPKALFAVKFEQRGNDVIGTARKTVYSGLFASESVFDHYKKLWQEIEFQGYEVQPLNGSKGIDKTAKYIGM